MNENINVKEIDHGHVEEKVLQHASIDKASYKEDPQSYGKLRQQALKFVQAFSGNLWSDYNSHDPGVNLLELYCYGLTEISYLADEDIVNLLTNSEQSESFHRYGLHSATEILPSASVTDDDLRKVFLDQISDIENIWFKPVYDKEGNKKPGLHHIQVNLSKNVDPIGSVDRQIRDIYSANRSLCEDIDRVSYVEELPCEITAKVEISESAIASDLLANIYTECERYISPHIDFYDYQEQISNSGKLDEIFEGPKIVSGLIAQESLQRTVQVIEITAITNIIRAVPGVVSVSQVAIVVDGVVHYDSYQLKDENHALFLQTPTLEQEITIELVRNEEKVALLFDNFLQRMGSLQNSEKFRTGGEYQYRELVETPKGRYRDFEEYYSIQNQFPTNYNLFRSLENNNLSELNKAQIKQYKAYLLLFDQMILHSLRQISSVGDLFDIRSQSQTKDFVGLLDSDVIPDVDSLYRTDIPHLEKHFHDLLDTSELGREKKHSALNILLSMYGEEYSGESLSRFNFYYDPTQLDHEIIRQKKRYIHNIVRINRDRGEGYNYLKQSLNSQNVSGLQFKLSHELCFRYVESRSLTLNFTRLGLKLVPEDDFRAGPDQSDQPRFVQLDDIKAFKALGFRYVAVDAEIQKKSKLSDLMPFVKSLVPFRQNIISSKLVSDGVDLSCYRVGSLTDEADFQLAFLPKDGSPPYYLGSFSSLQKCCQAANAIQKIILWLNLNSEGMHLIEHLLLRDDSHAETQKAEEYSFYFQRISIFMPNWSARFSNKEFQLYTEQTIQRTAPAHVVSDIYWLDHDQMFEFEVILRNWSKRKADLTSSEREIKEVNEKMISFIKLLHSANR